MLQGTTEEITEQAAIIEAIRRFQAGTKEVWYACVEKSLPAFSIGRVREGYLAAKARGVRICYITEIVRENIGYCKEIMQFAEIRHMYGVKCNFALSESEFIAGIMQGGTLVSLVRTNIQGLVRQQHLVFQTLWDCSEQSAERIARLE